MGAPREYKQLGNNIFFVNSSIPHVVYILENTDVHDKKELKKLKELGKNTRNSKNLQEIVGHPDAYEVNFAEIIDSNSLKLTTYEKGIEDLPLACGTGSAASAYVAHINFGLKFPITVINRGGSPIINYSDGELQMTGPAKYL